MKKKAKFVSMAMEMKINDTKYKILIVLDQNYKHTRTTLQDKAEIECRQEYVHSTRSHSITMGSNTGGIGILDPPNISNRFLSSRRPNFLHNKQIKVELHFSLSSMCWCDVEFSSIILNTVTLQNL